MLITFYQIIGPDAFVTLHYPWCAPFQLVRRHSYNHHSLLIRYTSLFQAIPITITHIKMNTSAARWIDKSGTPFLVHESFVTQMALMIPARLSSSNVLFDQRILGSTWIAYICLRHQIKNEIGLFRTQTTMKNSELTSHKPPSPWHMPRQRPSIHAARRRFKRTLLALFNWKEFNCIFNMFEQVFILFFYKLYL